MTNSSESRQWAVQMPTEAGPVYYGPFSQHEYAVAERFARFVTEEIDPARVVPATEGLKAGAAWRPPLGELLNWRDSMSPTLEDWPHLFPPDDPRHRHDTNAAGICRNSLCGYCSDAASAHDICEPGSRG